MIVYITTNLINGKKYIGSDSNNNPNYLGSGTGFVKALKKYGKKNFKKQTLATATCYEEMRELEEYYISYYNAHKSSLFYNRSDKGQGQGSGERHWNFGKKLKIETKNKKSQSMFGKKLHSDEQKQKWSEMKKGIKLPNFSKPKNSQGKIGEGGCRGSCFSIRRGLEILKLNQADCYPIPTVLSYLIQ
jgi:hypothetical protein